MLSDGSLGFSTVYVVAHRQLNTSMRHVELRLASANRTVRASHEHLLPLARGGLAACAADAAAQRLLPAGAAAVGDALWAVTVDAGGGERLVCTPISAVERHDEVGFASPFTFSGYIIVDGVAASSWSAPFHPLAKAWRLAHHFGDWEEVATRPASSVSAFGPSNEALVRTVQFLLFGAPFRALYLTLAAVRALLPAGWQLAAAHAADDFTARRASAYVDAIVGSTRDQVRTFSSDSVFIFVGRIAVRSALSAEGLAALLAAITGVWLSGRWRRGG